ncbi:surA [Symbiodinium sp. CCMP2592]|nr:surA [Symbiodinium sp. CCMP2592]
MMSKNGPPVADETWAVKVQSHRASLRELYASVQRLRSTLQPAMAVLGDTSVALKGAAEAVEKWSSTRTMEGDLLQEAAAQLAGIRDAQVRLKKALQAECPKGGKDSASVGAAPKPIRTNCGGRTAVDFSLFTRARWEAERRKGASMLAGGEGDSVKVFTQEMPKAFPEEKACTQVRGRHILVNNVEKAKRVYLEMAVTGTADRNGFLRHASGAKFASLASERSECHSAKTGGDLGWIVKDPAPSKLQEVAFATPRSSCSPPFKSGNGFHIFFCEERR